MNLRRISHELRNTSWTIQENEIIVNETTKFILPKLYPFHYPTLMISHHSHLELLKTYFLKHVEFCKLCHIRLPCICCESILSRWSPCYTCKDIYMEFLVFKRKVYDLYVLHKLYDKNIPDIIIKEISSYLL